MCIDPSTQPMHTRQQQQNTLPVQVFNSNPSSSALNSTPSGFAQQTELIKVILILCIPVTALFCFLLVYHSFLKNANINNNKAKIIIKYI